MSLDRPRGRSVLAHLGVAHFSHHVGNSLLVPLLPLMRESFALSYAQVGLLATGFHVGNGLANTPWGLIADRLGPRPVVICGLLFTGLAIAAVGAAPSYVVLLLLLAVLGIASGAYHPGATAILAGSFAPRARATAIGLHITVGHTAFVLVPLVAVLLVDVGGSWRTPYQWLSVAPLLAGALLWRRLPSGIAREVQFATGRSVVESLRGAVRSLGPIIVLSLLFQVVVSALFSFLSLYLVDARGFSPAAAAGSISILLLFAVASPVLGGWLADRLGRISVIVVGLIGVGPSVLALSLAPVEAIVVPLGLLGLTLAMRQSATEVLVAELAPAHGRALVLGVYYTLGQEFGGLAAPLLGALAGLVGIESAFNAVGAVLCAFSTGLLILLVWRRTRSRGGL